MNQVIGDIKTSTLVPTQHIVESALRKITAQYSSLLLPTLIVKSPFHFFSFHVKEKLTAVVVRYRPEKYRSFDNRELFSFSLPLISTVPIN